MLHNNRMKLENTATAIVCMGMILAFSMISYAKTDANEPPVGFTLFKSFCRMGAGRFFSILLFTASPQDNL